MYAWEKAFEKIISQIRNKEFKGYLAMNLLTCLDRSVGNFSNIWGSLVFFVIIYYGNFTILTSANMISTL